MSALAVLTCCINSHPFQERRISLTEPTKIGRSVAQSRPALTNAIFDCKVLSRNHALMWYENGKFYLQDTKSSNGTFVNSHRLSKGSEESSPREIFSSDTVQFGVDVMENSRKVTHSCIIATVQLFHPDGREAVNSHSNSDTNVSANNTLQSQELYQLAQHLQEALHREQVLENKLATLQRLVQSTQEATENGWQALIDEDRLLSRLEILENQLSIYAKSHTEDALKQEIVALQDDKYRYETNAKDSLRKVLEEKLEAVRKLSDLESSLNNTEEECSHLQEMCQMSQKELELLAEKYQEQVQEVRDLQEKLQEAEKRHEEDEEEVQKEKVKLLMKIDELLEQEEKLQARIESLQAENDFTTEQLNNMKAKMEAMKKMSTETPKIPEFDSRGTQVDLVNLLDLQLLSNDEKSDDDAGPDFEGNHKDEDEEFDHPDLETSLMTLSSNVCTSQSPNLHNNMSNYETEELTKTRESIASYKDQLEACTAKLEESRLLVVNLQQQLEAACSEAVIQAEKISSLEEQLKQSDVRLNTMVESAVTDLKSQLFEAEKQNKSFSELSKSWQDQIADLEGQLSQYRNVESCSKTNSIAPPTAIELMVNHSPPSDSDLDSNKESARDGDQSSDGFHDNIVKLQEMLFRSNEAQKLSQSEIERYKGELEELREKTGRAVSEAESFKLQLSEALNRAKESSEHASSLLEKVGKTELGNKELQTQIVNLKEQLEDAQLSAKSNCTELEQLRARVRTLQEELEYERLKGTSVGTENISSVQQEIQREAAKNRVEFSMLKEECSQLRQRIQDIETEMKMSRRENTQLKLEYGRLQESYEELEQLKDKLQNKETTWQLNLTDAQKEADQTRIELSDARDKINELKEKCDHCKDEVLALHSELESTIDEYATLSSRSRTVSTFSMIPLLMLLLAFILAFYPFLSSITATSIPPHNT